MGETTKHIAKNLTERARDGANRDITQHSSNKEVNATQIQDK